MKYNKLVRDKIPEIIKESGGTPITHIAADVEYWLKLKEKLLEEIKEFFENESIEELADVKEVLNAIRDYKGFSESELEATRVAKAEKRGAFEKRIILEES
ncbi:MAG TPA: nucleoside triphosphate pyrophosphohydrolase [Candidatus Colwellbacteria bacterium]|nr:nucleoside triphosphate pyrophosphohydrolase [Candidatus Colwellbacteria bacterium]HQA96060.1 nucleoside triphosphate pyrophosphohydrolase [Candidatus Colwellbacteria bacterium]